MSLRRTTLMMLFGGPALASSCPVRARHLADRRPGFSATGTQCDAHLGCVLRQALTITGFLDRVPRGTHGRDHSPLDIREPVTNSLVP